jgi:hypothetical protein
MPPASEPVRVPVAFFDTLQLLCPLLVLATVAVDVPAVEVNFDGGITANLFRAYGGERVQWGVALCTVLAVVQLAGVRDARRGSPRRALGIVVALLSFGAGVFLAHSAYRVGFASPSGLEALPHPATYVGAFAGLGFALLAFTRLGRFGEPDVPLAPPPPPPAAPEPGQPQ